MHFLLSPIIMSGWFWRPCDTAHEREREKVVDIFIIPATNEHAHSGYV